jgi:hypothetical protein
MSEEKTEIGATEEVKTDGTELPANTEIKTEQTAGSSEGTESAAEQKPVVPPKDDWRDKRISQLTAKLREAEGKVAAAGQQQNPGETQAQFDARVREEAQRLSQVESFNAKCTEAVDTGRKEFENFDGRVAELKRLATDPDSSTAYTNLIAATLETGEAPKLIHLLGGDLNEAARIMNLSPVKMGIELAKLAAKEPEQMSEASKPIRALGSAALHTAIDPADPERSDRLTTAQFMERRNAQIEAQRKRA